MANIKFTKSTEFSVTFGKRTVPWYESNFGNWFLKASDLVRLLCLDKDEAKAVYEDVLPQPLQTAYLGRELTGCLLHALKELSDGESFTLWTQIKGDFYLDAPATKFDMPILPYMRSDGKLETAMDATLLYETDAVRALAGEGAEFHFAKKNRVVIPTRDLITSDSQVQKLLTGLNENKTLEYAEYKRVLTAAKRSPLTIMAPPAPPPKGAQLKKENSTLEAEIVRLNGLLLAHKINPDEKPTAKGKREQNKVLTQIETAKQQALAAVKTYLESQFVSLYAQTQLLKEIGLDIAGIYGGWDQKKYEEIFDNQKMLNLVTEIYAQCKHADTDIHTLTRLVDSAMQNQKQIVRKFIGLAHQHKAREAAAAKAKANGKKAA